MDQLKVKDRILENISLSVKKVSVQISRITLQKCDPESAGEFQMVEQSERYIRFCQRLGECQAGIQKHERACTHYATNP